MTAAARILEIFDTEPDIVAGTGRRRPRPRRPPALRARRLRLPRRARQARCCATSTSTSRPARRSRWSAPPARGKTILTALVPRLYDVTGGRITIDGVDVRDFTLERAPLARRHRVRGADAVLDERPREPHPRPRRRHRGRDQRGPRRSPRPSFAHDLPVGPRHPHRRAGHVALRRPAAAARAGARRARPARACSSSTTRSPRSTCTPRSSSRRRCAACSPTPPAWSWPTAPRPCCSPTGSPCSRTARSPTSATTASCWPTVPAYRELLAADADADLEGAVRHDRHATTDRPATEPGLARRRRRRLADDLTDETSARLADRLAPAARRPAAALRAARSSWLMVDRA